MKHLPLTSGLWFAIALAVAAPALADKSLEDAIESVSSEITLPANAPGGMLARSCPTCATQSYQLTSSTQYVVGGQSVSLAELRRRFAAARYPVVVAVRPDSSIVTRIVVTGDAYTR